MGKNVEDFFIVVVVFAFYHITKRMETHGTSKEMPNYNGNLRKYCEELALYPKIPVRVPERKRSNIQKGLTEYFRRGYLQRVQ